MTAPHIVPESVRRLWGVPESNDLPPLWDGVPVSWGGWSLAWSSLNYHLPLHELVCDKCGGLGDMGINWGMRPAEDGTQCRDIVAARCQDCGHDTVTDHRTKETWELDPDDYGDEGSTETKDTLF